MFKFSFNIKESISLIKNSFIPALFFAGGLLSFYGYVDISENAMLSLHYAFYILNFASFLILLYFNRRKPAFFILITLLSYILINYLKRTYGETYLTTPAFVNLCFFVPLNLAFFCFYPSKQLLIKENVYFLLGLFIQYAVAEKLSTANIALGYDFSSQTNNGLNDLSLLLFSALIVAAFIRASFNGYILSSALFFTIISIFFGFYYSSSPTALTLFFSSAALSLATAVGRNIHYTTYKDILTGLPSRNSYMVDAKKFPLKYSIGIICIDDYERLQRIFGHSGINALTCMITQRITETETEEPVYRYTEDEFVVIFKNEDKNTGYERLEKIRRAVASAEFILKGNSKPLKLTVSCSVSEKKRSDANSYEVLVRAHKAMQKTHQFSQNVTSKA